MTYQYYDYMELKLYMEKLRKENVWDTLDQEIKRLYWRDLKRLQRDAQVPWDDIDNKADDGQAVSQIPKQSESMKPSKKHEHPLSLERAQIELGSIIASPFSIEEYVIQKERLQAIYIAIDSLKPKHRTIAIPYYLEELTGREIAKQTGISQSTVARRKIKVDKILAQLLKDYR